MARHGILIVIGLALMIASCSDDDGAGTPATTTSSSSTASSTPPSSLTEPLSDQQYGDDAPWPEAITADHQQWTIEIVESRSHDPEAFTQGLEYLTGGQVLESTGRRGESTVRIWDAATSEEVRRADLDPALFGEGLTVVDGNEMIVLTWTSGFAQRMTIDTFDVIDTHTYDGEGWGLCHDDTDLWMSNGTATLTRRDTDSFTVLEEVEVTRDGAPVDQLNELECIDGRIVANVFNTNELVVIEPADGTVTATIDASLLADAIGPGVLADTSADLNGVADLRDGRLLLGGKLWPEFFVVELVA